jgi:hypothetical protein
MAFASTFSAGGSAGSGLTGASTFLTGGFAGSALGVSVAGFFSGTSQPAASTTIAANTILDIRILHTPFSPTS